MRHRDPIDTLRLQRGAEHLHTLGARATAVALAEVADRIGGMPAILAVLEAYQARVTGDDPDGWRRPVSVAAIAAGGTMMGAITGLSPEGIARGIDCMLRAGDDMHVPLLQALGAGRVAIVFAYGRTGGISPSALQRLRKPTMILIGDDDYAATGPAGWPCAKQAIRWCRSAIVHGSGADRSFYEGAVATTLLMWRLLVAETRSEQPRCWAAALAAKPTSIIQPRNNGPHPLKPARGEAH